MMKGTIRKVGNSEGVIIPKEVLQRLGLSSGGTASNCERSRVIFGSCRNRRTLPSKCGQPASAWKNIEWRSANPPGD